MALPVRSMKTGTEPNWTVVASSWLARIAFRPFPGSTYGNLLLETKDGKRYMYSGVPRFVWQMFRSDGSKGGSWWRLKLRDYPVTRLA
jgi:hypothetical protein